MVWLVHDLAGVGDVECQIVISTFVRFCTNKGFFPPKLLIMYFTYTHFLKMQMLWSVLLLEISKPILYILQLYFGIRMTVTIDWHLTVRA